MFTIYNIINKNNNYDNNYIFINRSSIFNIKNNYWNFFFFNWINYLNYNNYFFNKIKISIKLKFKQPKQFNLMNRYKHYLKLNNNLLLTNFKLNKFFKIYFKNNSKLYQLNNTSFPYKFYNTINLSFYKNNYHYLKKNIKYLTYAPLSPFYWDLHSKKKWIRKTLNFNYVKNNIYFNSNKFLTNGLNNKNITKKIYFNNFKYFNKLNLSYFNLNYLIKLKLLKNSKINNDWFLSKPYIFLNNINNYRYNNFFTNSFVINLYKNYSRIFNYFKRFNFLFKIKKSPNLIYKSFNSRSFIVNKKKSALILSPNTNFKNSLSIFLFKSKFFSNKIINNKNIKKQSKQFVLFLWTQSLINKTRFNKKNKLISLFYKKLLNTKKLYRLGKKTKKINYINFFKISNNHSFKTFKWLISKNYSPNTTTPVSNLFSHKNIILKSLIISNSRTNNSVFKIINFKNNYFNKKLPLKNKYKINFLHNIYGFLFLNNLQLSFSKKTTNFSNVKKFFFSFPYKNELQKFILKKYTKNNLISSYFLDDFKNSKNFNTSNSSTNNFTFYSLNNSLTTLLEANYFNSKNWFYFNSQLLFWKNFENETSDFNIKRVRFKPGYMTLWRDARKSLQISLSLNFKYQSKLTKYVSKFNKFIKFKTFLINEMTLNNILIRSRFFTEKTILTLFITNNLIYVNGFQTNNPLKQLYIGDFVQLIINLKYYILFKWLLNLSLKKKIRLRNVLRKKNTSFSSSDEKKRSTNLPKWIIFSQNSLDDVPKYLEIDYFTLSVFIIYEPFLWSDLNIYNILNNKFSIINTYNWKYIN